ncbi:FAD-dependent oxidoreductase [Frankia sp. AgPm24]|uniref:FAD-binding protein n=1 Tax=Frankia sp. AgPm24 TaxID=631128 RepID=UPI00200D598E|nr:FAD-binding protein [Frankia sp. AgPm24]MCK9921758.1 FAD-dependent oxidoreductase [Frankia sp. AgPm24]
MRFADAHGLTVAVQATGHGAVVRSQPSLLVHTGRLDEVSIDPVARRARVGAGVRWQQVLDAAGQDGLGALAGSAPHRGRHPHGRLPLPVDGRADRCRPRRRHRRRADHRRGRPGRTGHLDDPRPPHPARPRAGRPWPGRACPDTGRTARPVAGHFGHVGLVGPIPLALARLAALTGDLPAARAHLTTATELATHTGGVGALLRCRLLTVQLAVQSGRPLDDPARAELADIAARAESRGMPGLARDAHTLLDPSS